MYGRQHSGQASAHVSSKTMQRCMLAAQYADSHTLNVPLMNRMTTSPYMWTSAIADSCPSELFSTEGECTGFPPFCTATSKACLASSTVMPAAGHRFPDCAAKSLCSSCESLSKAQCKAPLMSAVHLTYSTHRQAMLVDKCIYVILLVGRYCWCTVCWCSLTGVRRCENEGKLIGF